MGEYPAKKAKDFVEKACSFLDGNFGCDVIQNCYEGKHAATVLLGGQRIRFDVIALKRRRESSSHGNNVRKIFFFCECKWRETPRNLKYELRKFLEKAMKTMPEIRGQYSENFRFMFICNAPFGVSQTDMQSIDYMRDFLTSQHTTAELNDLSSKIGILILTDWFFEDVVEGGI